MDFHSKIYMNKFKEVPNQEEKEEVNYESKPI
jgi:hypothetical protein